MEKKKVNKVLIAVIIIVSIPFLLLGIEIGCILIKFYAPDSAIAQSIDGVLNWFIRQFVM